MKKITQLIQIVKYIYFLSGPNPLKIYNNLTRFLLYYNKRKFSPEEILLYNMLSEESTCKYKENIYSNEEYLTLQKQLNPASFVQMTESKKYFYDLCEDKGIPTPKTLFHIKKVSLSNPKEQIESSIKNYLNSSPDGEFIVKPSSGTQGNGIFFYSKRANEFKITSGPALDLRNFTNHLSSLCSADDYLIQERVVNHVDIDSFAPSDALQTLRIYSLIIDEDCFILFCLFKQAGHGQLVDNFNKGQNKSTLWVVDSRTGQLVQGYQINENGYGYKGALSFKENICLPFWPESIELVKSASKKFLPLRTVGWDVAITDKGPIIIEGNCFFDPASSIENYDRENIYQQLKKQVDTHV